MTSKARDLSKFPNEIDDVNITGGSVSGASLTTANATITGGTIASSVLPAGTVLQVVQSSTNTQVVLASFTFANTGLSATITPTSSNSKILVIVNQNGVNKQVNNTSVDIRLRRGATVLTDFAISAGRTANNSENSVGSASTTLLDSPQTTSPITYDTQFRSRGDVSAVVVQHIGTVSSITLMEIAG